VLEPIFSRHSLAVPETSTLVAAAPQVSDTEWPMTRLIMSRWVQLCVVRYCGEAGGGTGLLGGGGRDAGDGEGGLLAAEVGYKV
jgi:hypothetical protein